jgi:hypothetical protein
MLKVAIFKVRENPVVVAGSSRFDKAVAVDQGQECRMTRNSTRILAFVAMTCGITSMPFAAGGADDEESAVFGVRIPAGYRNWGVIGVAHEAGKLNDLRAILGNDIAMKAYREGTRPFPDGAIIARLAWEYVPSSENDAIFGQPQSFVTGPPTNTQFSVKDSKRYASTGGWGYGQFEGGKPNRNEALLNGCFACHVRAPNADDFVFTHYAP